MKKNLESNLKSCPHDQPKNFLYRNHETDEIIVYERSTLKEIILQNLYGLKYTPAGPVAKVMISQREAMANPDAYAKAVNTAKLYTFKDAMNTIVDWFLDRADSIDKLEEKDYIRSIPNEKLWKEFFEETRKLKDKSKGEVRLSNDSDLDGGRA